MGSLSCLPPALTDPFCPLSLLPCLLAGRAAPSSQPSQRTHSAGDAVAPGAGPEPAQSGSPALRVGGETPDATEEHAQQAKAAVAAFETAAALVELPLKMLPGRPAVSPDVSALPGGGLDGPAFNSELGPGLLGGRGSSGPRGWSGPGPTIPPSFPSLSLFQALPKEDDGKWKTAGFRPDILQIVQALQAGGVLQDAWRGRDIYSSTGECAQTYCSIGCIF